MSRRSGEAGWLDAFLRNETIFWVWAAVSVGWDVEKTGVLLARAGEDADVGLVVKRAVWDGRRRIEAPFGRDTSCVAAEVPNVKKRGVSEF
ncbi:hypothetical protein SBA6_780003 [Candidatus Sulfopaludibacter sp. SbA6]|nr:hypothetical protein SBA6_780003 [Candidatus Sulfopaludibacter sp. SbA6]